MKIEYKNLCILNIQTFVFITPWNIVSCTKKKIKAAKTNILRVQLYTLTQRTTAISQKELLLGLRSEYYE